MKIPNEVPEIREGDLFFGEGICMKQSLGCHCQNKQFIGGKVEEKKLKVEEELVHSSSTFKAYSRHVSKLPQKVL